MEQKFDAEKPKAEITLSNRKATRSVVANDWGLQLRWVVRRDGKPVATAPARTAMSFQHEDATPGYYEIVLQMFQYIDYKKDAAGEYVNSKFVDISNAVSYKI